MNKNSKIKNNISFVYLVSIIGIISCYILPQIKYRISNDILAVICGLFLLTQVILNSKIIIIYRKVIPWMLVASLMLGVFTYPLDFKQGLLFLMEQFLTLVPFFIFISIAQRNNVREIKIIFFVISILFILVEIRTIVEFSVNPNIARFLAAGSTDVTHTYYRFEGVGGYSFSYAVGLITPFLLTLFFNVVRLKWKILALAFFILSFVYVIQCQFAILTILVILSILLIFIIRIKAPITRIVIYCFVGLIIFTLPTIFHYFASITEGSAISSRLNDISIFLKYGAIASDAMIGRQDIYTAGLQIFLKSPIWGNVAANEPKIFQAHSIIIDFASAIGLIGLYLIVKTWLVSKENIFIIIGEDLGNKLFKVPFIYFIILATVNLNIGAVEVWLALFLFVPLGILVFHKEVRSK